MVFLHATVDQWNSLPKVVVDAGRWSRFRGRQGRNVEKQFTAGFWITKRCGFRKSQNQLEVGTALAETACLVSHLPPCSSYGYCLSPFRLKSWRSVFKIFTSVWVALCFRAWTPRGGHSLHLRILAVRQHLGRAPWDTVSVTNEPRKTLHPPPASQVMNSRFSSALNIALKWYSTLPFPSPLSYFCFFSDMRKICME